MRIKDLVVDCSHAASVARFWPAVLGGYHVTPYEVINAVPHVIRLDGQHHHGRVNSQGLGSRLGSWLGSVAGDRLANARRARRKERTLVVATGDRATR